MALSVRTVPQIIQRRAPFVVAAKDQVPDVAGWPAPRWTGRGRGWPRLRRL